jgi:hypothetical protein
MLKMALNVINITYFKCSIQQKKVHDATMKSAALQRETEMLRSMVDKQKSQIHQLQDLLANREQQHR